MDDPVYILANGNLSVTNKKSSSKSAIPELNGITISHKPGCFQENGQWKGVAFDILKRLEKVGACIQEDNDKLKC